MVRFFLSTAFWMGIAAFALLSMLYSVFSFTIGPLDPYSADQALKSIVAISVACGVLSAPFMLWSEVRAHRSFVRRMTEESIYGPVFELAPDFNGSFFSPRGNRIKMLMKMPNGEVRYVAVPRNRIIVRPLDDHEGPPWALMSFRKEFASVPCRASHYWAVNNLVWRMLITGRPEDCTFLVR